MKYTEIKVKCNVADLEQVSDIVSMVDSFLKIEDYSDFDSAQAGYDGLVDEALLQADREHAAVSFFVPEGQDPADAVAFLTQQFEQAGLHNQILQQETENTDWENEWKKYYHPIAAGERLVIVPAWQDYDPAAEEVIVRIDPGLAFGTGTHESTRLCLGLIEQYLRAGDAVLDVGTGSGILAIAAKKLGAAQVRGLDIDPVAVRSAGENALMNGVEIEFETAEIAGEKGSFQLIVANIVADVILSIAPDAFKRLSPGGLLIASGIIREREGEVAEALRAVGFTQVESRAEGEWCALCFTKGC